MQLRQEFLVHEPKLLAKGALLENLFDQAAQQEILGQE